MAKKTTTAAKKKATASPSASRAKKATPKKAPTKKTPAKKTATKTKVATKKSTEKKPASSASKTPGSSTSKTTKKSAPTKTSTKKVVSKKKPSPAKGSSDEVENTTPKKTTSKSSKPAKSSASAKTVKEVAKPAPKTKAAQPKPEKAPAKKTSSKDAKTQSPKADTATSNGEVEASKKPPTKKDAQRSLIERMLPTGGLLSGSIRRAPLIASGPKAKKAAADESVDDRPVIKKTPFKKKELADFKLLLLQKRSELLGNVTNMEREALQSFGGGTSNTPQHMAEQGSDASEQSLSLDLAAHERGLIKEIDEALERLEAGTYGICVMTGKPIRLERLHELPWAKYSIEAARMLDAQRYGSR
ncbi:MAG: hypothetical protein H6815_11810 [Phycisphaeraceae bacterium]|nr:hypothetical protein [Phycisphaerales bacterium]MCB9861125.1 hypothetical protein [Phycisphaeraceae bacterium]